ncbi:peptidase [Sphingobium jiangsuense]|uniref:Putative proteasome-type protease n=1 Tax=Sphingobium jiangsuense TaxID=870476 RepID=A0A7W6BI47_9SPHN|nr:proteasome-type protease [Sphingobium jiangsuense]MBB3927436.1 putative proteasome-type protease [Sphingobium jiangsuense]GLT02681.1 peptidase [Sphingobium jiangsuense]
MTYCVGMQIDAGLIFMSDTRTNAGVDNISTFRKMYSWETPGERVVTIMAAGNLATTQSVISQLGERDKRPQEDRPSLLRARSMFAIANIIGETLRDTIRGDALSGETAESQFGATFIVGGQIRGLPPRLFLVYPEGNFIEATPDTPFFQIGETKYGRPILVRAYDPQMSFADAAKLLMVSFDSTLKANLTVGLPFDMQIVPVDQCRIGFETRIQADDPYFNEISRSWGNALKQAFRSLPPYDLPL